MRSFFYFAKTLALGLILHLPYANADTYERLAPALSTQQSTKILSPDAEVLNLIERSTLKNDGHWERTSYISIRVNDVDSARDYGRINISYNHYYSEMNLEFANTLSKNGELKSIQEDAIQERVTGGGQDFYSDRSELVFSLPDINPGSILEFQYTVKSKTLPLPELYADTVYPFWFQSTTANDSWRADYVHNHSYQFTYPQDTQIYPKRFAGFTPKKKKSNTNGLITETWTSKHVQPLTSEQWYPDSQKIVPQLRFSTVNDWGVVQQWSWENVKDKIQPSPTVKKVIKSLNLADDASAEEKVKAVYTYVQNNIRYVFAHLGRGGYEPHFPKEIVDAQYGDCKDQTVLSVALLNALGIQAYPALVQTRRSGTNDPAIVDLFFDHMITYIPEQTGIHAVWMDTTGDRSLYPGISNYLVDQNAFVIDSTETQLTKIDEHMLAENKALLFLNYTVNSKGQPVADLTINLSGTFEQNMRSWWTYNSNRENELEQYVSGMFNTQLGYELEASVHNHDALFEPIHIKAKYTFKPQEEDEPVSFSASTGQLLSMYANISSLPNPKTRKNPFYDPHPYTLKLLASFKGNTHQTPTLTQSSDGLETDFFTLNQLGHYKDNAYIYEVTYEKPPLDLSTEKYGYYHDYANKATQREPWVVALLEDKTHIDKKEFSKNTVESKILITQNLLNQGKFEEALITATEATNLDKSNGQAWYLLGTAQGLNAEFDSSNESFERAKALGYLP